jgi:hypothetical protein
MSFPRDAASGDADGDLEAAVAGALSVSSFRGALETLRLAARIPVASVRRVLEVAAPRGRAEGALEAWRRGSDFTVYGIYNAINDDAALLSTLKERFDAEAQAAALLRRFDDAESYAREETAVGG